MNHTLKPRWQLEEGWFSLILLALMVFSNIWCIQALDWAPHLDLLGPVGFLGLVAGYLAVCRVQTPRSLLHLAAFELGLVVCNWQISHVATHLSTRGFALHLAAWVAKAWTNSRSYDNSVFVFYLLLLTWILAYTSVWFTFRTRQPWLAIVANGTVLLINLSYAEPALLIYLVIFLFIALLLLVRINVQRYSRQWRRQGLRYSSELNWNVMQAGLLFTVGSLVLSWLVPPLQVSGQVNTIWDTAIQPWNATQMRINHIFASVGGGSRGDNTISSFSERLTLHGAINLSDIPVLQVRSAESHYWLGVTFDTYDGHSWFDTQTTRVDQEAQSPIPADSFYTHPLAQTITILRPKGNILFGASQLIQANLPGQLNGSLDHVSAWHSRSSIRPGLTYQVISAISNADPETLRNVKAPDLSQGHGRPFDSGSIDASASYPSTITGRYMQLPDSVTKRTIGLALQLTQNAPTMYDKALIIENYLHSLHYNNKIDPPPPLQDVVDYFLFDSKVGYCDYFASSMAVMMRSLGMPARVVSGYATGKLDPATHTYIAREADAHTWTQVYFGQYGWVNFEPSASFGLFSRPKPGSIAQSPAAGTVSPIATSPALQRSRLRDQADAARKAKQQHVAYTQRMQAIIISSSMLLGLVVLLLLGALWWWRSLFVRLNPVEQVYGKLCLLAGWVGIRPRPTQTPYEYLHELQQTLPGLTPHLDHLGDLYVQRRYGQGAHTGVLLARPDPVGSSYDDQQKGISTSDEETNVEDIWGPVRNTLLIEAFKRGKKPWN